MTDTKQITFEGREYTVPVWVEWVARDKNGIVSGFNEKPMSYIGDFWFVDSQNGGKSFRLLPKYFTNSKLEIVSPWSQSLAKA